MQSPLHAEHEKLGAMFTDFGGWQMPLRYGNELDEHRAVRTTAGLFDLSHMGEVRVAGAEAGKFLDYALISQLSAIAVGRAKYTMIVNEEGGIIDDLIVYRLDESEYLVVPNAGNAVTVAGLLADRAEGFDVTVTDESQDTALIAVQGPRAAEMLGDIPELKYYSAAPAKILGYDVLLARTGYTGEDGFELFIPAAQATALWQALIDAGCAVELLPCGLASRDSLRLEAGMPLYGHELSLDLKPADAGLGVLVSKKKTEAFVGSEALLADYTPPRKLIGLQGEGRRAARAGSAVLDSSGEVIGEVTSGQLSPTLGYPIALAYVDAKFADEDTTLDVDIRGKQHKYTVVNLPFYSRPKD